MSRSGYTADQVRTAERPLLDAGVPLMRRAAAGLAAELRRQVAEHHLTEIVLLAGSGDNGGDGLYAVAELAADGIPVSVIPTGSRLHEGGATAALAAGAVLRLDPASSGPVLPEGAVLVVDAILGIGARGAGLRGRGREMVAALLAAAPARRVVAVDLPSGIGVDDGTIPDDGVVLSADVTVTFGAVKAGLLLAPAAAVAGEVRLIDIGLGPALEGVVPAVVVD